MAERARKRALSGHGHVYPPLSSPFQKLNYGAHTSQRYSTTSSLRKANIVTKLRISIMFCAPCFPLERSEAFA
jgi:hypothetical protein